MAIIIYTTNPSMKKFASEILVLGSYSKLLKMNVIKLQTIASVTFDLLLLFNSRIRKNKSLCQPPLNCNKLVNKNYSNNKLLRHQVLIKKNLMKFRITNKSALVHNKNYQEEINK